MSEKEENGKRKSLILADLAIDSLQYYHDDKGSKERGGTYGNNYAASEIRKWLNEDFYNAAFNEMQKKLIEITNVDNSANSAGGGNNVSYCEDTNDKVFLLSYKESTTYLRRSLDRRTGSSAYAKCQGASQNENYYDNCEWWLRSGFGGNDNCACYVYVDGIVGTYGLVGTTSIGVRPALYINLTE